MQCGRSSAVERQLPKLNVVGSTPIARWFFFSLWVAGCAATDTTTLAPLPPSTSRPTLQGSYHVVQRGETLWRIARSYGLEPRVLAAVNRIPSATQLQVGQRLYLPLPPETRQFLWPLRGAVKPASRSTGVAILAPTGSLVRASRSGRVAVATHQLSGWGKTVVLDHFDGYLTVYAGLNRILVSPGGDLRQGMPLGSVGDRALFFEIRDGAVAKNTLALLPKD